MMPRQEIFHRFTLVIIFPFIVVQRIFYLTILINWHAIISLDWVSNHISLGFCVSVQHLNAQSQHFKNIFYT